MKPKTSRIVSALLCLLSITSGLAAGCKDDKIGETVPAPPRDLAEKSLRIGKAPIAGGASGQNQPAAK